jgi:hypothetical protein
MLVNPIKMRKELKVDWNTELQLMDQLCDKLVYYGLNASNTVVVTVSNDYSSVVGQYIRHQLTYNGEICEGFGVDVPYPDQSFDEKFVKDICTMFEMNKDSLEYKIILLVEAGVIRGGNYTKVVDIIKNELFTDQPILTLAMYENIGSKFKSDFVGEYYDDTIQDLTFWWEQPNKHWK